MFVAVPAHVLANTVTAVMRTWPPRHRAILDRWQKVFRADLLAPGCTPILANGFAVSCGRAVLAQLPAEGGAR